MAKQKSVTIDEHKKLSESLLWFGQRQFYDDKGIDAWSGDVPFYITSNPFIAQAYAKTIVQFICEWSTIHSNATDEPFYIIELGAGSGQFSFYMVKHLNNLRERLGINRCKIKYIMTDFTQNNIDFWQKHDCLQEYKKNQLLDFALFDIENDTELNLVESQITLSAKKPMKNPIIVIANYLFDSIVKDIFYVKNKKLYESLVALETPNSNIKNKSPKNWKKVKIAHDEKQIKTDYYQNDNFNVALAKYQQQIKDSYILYPIGGLRGIYNLQQLSQDNNLLLISSDKGYTAIEEQDELPYPELDFHGSFSLMVNYHAIQEYCRSCKGEGYMQSSHDGIATCVFTSGFSLDNYKETALAVDELIKEFTPSDYFNFYEHMEKTYEQAELKTLASYLSLSKWDAFIYQQIHERLSSLIESEDDQVIDYILENVQEIADNFYFLPGCEDIFFSMGLMFYEIDHFDSAIKYYKLSLKYFGEDFETIHNIGLCYYYDEDYKNAIHYFNQALRLQPSHKQLKGLIKTAKNKLKK